MRPVEDFCSPCPAMVEDVTKFTDDSLEIRRAFSEHQYVRPKLERELRFADPKILGDGRQNIRVAESCLNRTSTAKPAKPALTTKGNLRRVISRVQHAGKFGTL